MDDKLSFMCDIMRGDKCIVEMHWETGRQKMQKIIQYK